MWNEIPGSETWQEVTRLTKGWSDDEKYKVEADGRQYLLRLSPPERPEKRRAEYDTITSLHGKGLPVPQPVRMGKADGREYALYLWTPGEDANDVLPTLPPAQQYAMGVQAGEALRQIHEIPAPTLQPGWGQRYQRKIDVKLERYAASPMHLLGEAGYLSFIAEHRGAAQDCAQTLQHGDFHTGNLLIDGEQVRIIDFDRLDYGDPWEEFNRIVFSAQVSPAFAGGQIDGYFHGAVPPLFWERMALYIAVNQVGALPWATSFGKTEEEFALRQARDVLQWYDGFHVLIPSWYDGKK